MHVVLTATDNRIVKLDAPAGVTIEGMHITIHAIDKAYHLYYMRDDNLHASRDLAHTFKSIVVVP